MVDVRRPLGRGRSSTRPALPQTPLRAQHGLSFPGPAPPRTLLSGPGPTTDSPLRARPHHGRSPTQLEAVGVRPGTGQHTMEPGNSADGTSAAVKASTGLSESCMEFERYGELICVNQETVEKLTEGLVSHYLPDLKQLKNSLQELTQNQVVLLDTLEQQIAKFRECHLVLDINALFTEAKYYHDKLVNIRKEMVTLHEKTTRLKKRALKLQQQRRRDELECEQRRERELERERQLVARPAKLPQAASER